MFMHMGRKAIGTSVAAALLAAGAMGLHVQTTQAAGGRAVPVAYVSTTHFKGTFLHVLNAKNEFTMLEQNGKTEKTFTIAEAAKITRDGKKATLDDLKKGDVVLITAEKKLLMHDIATVVEARSQK